MIITELNGGLGNQMFQYAVARRLAEVNHTELKLDIENLKKDRLRTYELHHLNVNAQFAVYDDIAIFKERSKRKKIKFYIRQILSRKKLRNIKEKHFHFDESILFLKDNIYLQGYWQTEKYFKDISDIIRREFSLKEKLSEESQQVAQKIKMSANSVSLHIRRGDYVTDTTTNSTHGTCSLDYYQKCVKKLAEKFSDLQLFVFSDDPEWVKVNLHFKYPTVFVNHNGVECAFEDMHLMSLCMHNIIANSSFSWWGAWLNNNPYKVVFAPKHWFKKEEMNTKDLIPDSWIRV